MLSFGRPGYGAPVRTKSGRLRTSLRGSPEIRFQDNGSVRNSINNAIRYQIDPEVKAQYHKDLGTKKEFILSFPTLFLFFFQRNKSANARRPRGRREKGRGTWLRSW